MDPALYEMMEGPGEDEVEVIIRLRDPDWVPDDVRLVARFGTIATCRLRRDAILKVRADEACASLKAPLYRYVVPEPEIPLSASEAAREYTPRDDRRPSSLGVTGRGGVVGVLDWGCDFAHPNFRNEDGTTRLLALWGQRGGPLAGSPHPYGYGTLYTAAAINAALRRADPYKALGYRPPVGAHGTHVMDIAAGSGRVGPMGVAPDADLVFVDMSTRGTSELANLGDAVTILEAVDFVFKQAGERPCVINMSLGRRGGPKDATTLVVQGLDRAVSAAPGRCIVNSAGNYYQQQSHASGLLRPGETRTLFLEIDEVDRTPNEVEVWYSGRDVFSVEISTPDRRQVGRAALGERGSIQLDGREVCRIYHRAYDPNNGDHLIDIFLFPGSPGGEWELRLTGEDVVDGRYHAWIERDAACARCDARFHRDDANPAYTTGTICNGYRTIAVGAYDSRLPGRPIGAFSSRGPTRDGRQKPDLVAPGVAVLAARSAAREVEGESPELTRKSGASMAAPHVTGCVALMFEATRRPLSIEETRRLLLSSTDPVTDPDFDLRRIGSGYLNVERAAEMARGVANASLAAAPRASANGASNWKSRASNRENVTTEAPMQVTPMQEAGTFIERGKKRNFILVSGGSGPFSTRDVEHDQSWANYVTPPLLMTDTSEKREKFAEADEEVWWFVYKPAYERRWREDVNSPHKSRKEAVKDVKDKGAASYVDLIEKRAKQRGWNLRWLRGADDFWSKLKTFTDPISRVWYWGHARQDLWLSLRHNDDGDAVAPVSDAIITVESIARNSTLKSRFQAGEPTCVHRFVGCNTDRFADAWSKTFRVWSEGFKRKVDFKAIHKTGGGTGARREGEEVSLLTQAPGSSACGSEAGRAFLRRHGHRRTRRDDRRRLRAGRIRRD